MEDLAIKVKCKKCGKEITEEKDFFGCIYSECKGCSTINIKL